MAKSNAAHAAWRCGVKGANPADGVGHGNQEADELEQYPDGR